MRKATVASLIVLLCTAAEAREGFGFTKRSADMIVRKPPAIVISGTRVLVTATGERTRIADDAQVLRKYVEELIAAGDTRLSISSSPDVTLAIDLDRLDYESRSESKVENESQKTKDKDGKTKYVDVPVTKYYKTVDAAIAGTFKIDGARGRSLDSGDFDDKFNKEYESSAPERRTIIDDLLHGAARTIASRIVPTTQRVPVLLPKGSFESYAPLAESNSWDAYLRAVEAVPPNRDAASEAFRQYALGVAREGLAHATPDKAKALELLRAAAENYRTAIQSNPGEKLFSQRYNSLLNSSEAPLARAESSVAAYEAWVKAVPAGAHSDSARSSSKSSKVMRNDTVFEMSQAGLADDVIIAAIDTASSTSFDTSPDALIALSKGGVGSAVIRRMQRKAK
jgi:hypothetical protein